MSVASHLNIRVEEYDERIRTFVPSYEEMISVAANGLNLVVERSPVILDLGIGTGELAERCLKVRPDARIIGIDVDSGILSVARKRLGNRVELVEGDFRSIQLPRCDAMVACIALHHIRERGEKMRFYGRCAESLRPGGILVSADCFPAREGRLADEQREAWLRHLEKSYSRREAEGHLSSWAAEDKYFPLLDELGWMTAAGLTTEVVWRFQSFGVILGKRSP